MISTKIRNLDKILNAIGNFGWPKNDILDKIFFVFLNMLVAQYKISATSTVTF